MIKVSGLSRNREKKRNPRLTWMMFQHIYIVYRNINNKEEINAYMLLISISNHEQATKLNKECDDSWDNAENNQPFMQNMNIPSDLNDIQPRSTQVWNCDEIGFDPYGRRNKVVFTCKFFQGKLMLKVKTGERAPFWCTLLVFT